MVGLWKQIDQVHLLHPVATRGEHSQVARQRCRIARHIRQPGSRQLSETARHALAQGFLLPVLCGYFDPTAAHSTYEQPIADWIAELAAAGYTATARPLDDYWWATAQLIDARPAPAS